MEVAHVFLTGDGLGRFDLIGLMFERHHVGILSKAFWVANACSSGALILALVCFMNGAPLLSSLGLGYAFSTLLAMIGLVLNGERPPEPKKVIKPVVFAVLIMGVLGIENAFFPQWVLMAYIPFFALHFTVNVLNYPRIDHRKDMDSLRDRFEYAVQIFPGYLLAVLALNAITRAMSAIRGVQLTESRNDDKELERLRTLPAGELVREYAIKEIQKIEQDLLGSGSEMRRVEASLRSRLDGAEAMRLQISSRATRGGDVMRQGLKVAEERVGELRKVLSRHQDVIARATAILSECMVSAKGLSDAVADAELLKNLEEQAMEDQKHVALSELAMEQSVDQLRRRVMSLEGTLAQLETKRLTDADPSRDEQAAYLERIEMVATRLASV